MAAWDHYGHQVSCTRAALLIQPWAGTGSFQHWFGNNQTSLDEWGKRWHSEWPNWPLLHLPKPAESKAPGVQWQGVGQTPETGQHQPCSKHPKQVINGRFLKVFISTCHRCEAFEEFTVETLPATSIVSLIIQFNFLFFYFNTFRHGQTIRFSLFLSPVCVMLYKTAISNFWQHTSCINTTTHKN